MSSHLICHDFVGGASILMLVPLIGREHQFERRMLYP
jgi:hypothetical protein